MSDRPKKQPVIAVPDLLALARRALRQVYFLLRCHCVPPDDDGASLYEDIAGVDVLVGKAGAVHASPRIFSFSELYIGTNGFSEKEILGRGGFGRVYRASLPSDGTIAAVKCVAKRGDRFEKSFAAELVAVARLRHKNLVRLRGWCVHDEQLLLVYDYMENHSLDRHLFTPPTSKAAVLDWGRRQRIVAGLAAGLCYLHEQLEAQIIHRDVKASNVMLDKEYNARLGDFGLARWLEHDGDLGLSMSVRAASVSNYQFRLSETSHVGGTIGYVPPESFQRRGGGTAKSDVFSFGIVVLEVATGRRAVDLAYPEDRIFMLDWVRRLSDERELAGAVDGKLKSRCDLQSVGRIVHIGLLCTLHDPRSRPTMKWVVSNLGDGGELPVLPSFRALPMYISLSDSSSGTSNTSGGVTGTEYFSSTVYLTADDRFNNATTAVGPTLSCAAAAMIANIDTPREIPYNEIVAITGNFAHSQIVAELDFGTGYRGFLDNRVHVLVKRLGMKTCPALRLRYADELRNLAGLRHRSLMQLRGWCTDNGEMLVVYDFAPASSLLSHHLIHRDNSDALPWRHRYNIIKSLASAVLYLHEEWDEQVLHRNITSSAVFIDPGDMSPRLGCFALAEFLSRSSHSGGDHHVIPTSSSRGVFGYMAPECTEGAAAGAAADVYSFGVVVLEAVMGRMAVDMRTPEVLLVRRVHRRPLQQLSTLADCRLAGAYDEREMARMAKLGVVCTRTAPAGRPTMRQVVGILDGDDALLDRVLDNNTDAGDGGEAWERNNANAVAMAKRIQALGLH